MNALQRLMANGSVRFGATVLGLMLLVAAFAPFLGTVDPAAMDSSFINKADGASGLFALLDGYGYKIAEAYVTLLGQWGMLVMTAYFGGRTVEKVMELRNKGKTQ